MSMVYDVIIAGAGPVGLMLASELGLARLSVLVLERDVEPQSQWKSLPLGRRGLNVPCVESFYRRGLLEKLFPPGERSDSTLNLKVGDKYQFSGHFAGMMLDSSQLNLNRWKYRLPGPALLGGMTSVADVERVLTERAEHVGVTILRGSAVTNVDQDDAGVTVSTGDQCLRCQWLVGCDGGHSTIRKAAGFDFTGTDPRFTGYIASCDFDHPERLPRGFYHHSQQGMYILTPNRIFLSDFDGGAAHRTREVTQEILQDVFERITRITDVHITKIHLAGTFTDRCGQATQYRRGRILLAGDAAHIHSPIGAQGLNLGLGDAFNLGWKLAATIRGGSTDLTLLDTYERECHPLGEWALDWTRVQVETIQPGPSGVALRNLMRDLMATSDGANHFIDRFFSLSNRFDLNDPHPLVGSSAPDLTFEDGSRLGPKMASGRGLLVDFENQLGSLANNRIDFVGLDAKDRLGLRAFLIRPDGVVVWVAEGEPDMISARMALDRWFTA